MGRAILEMQDLYIAVELPDDVVREFILEALGGKLGELPGKPDRAQEEPPPSDNDSQPEAAQEVPVFLKLNREEKEQQILEVIESSGDKITTSMIAKQLGVKSNHISKILSDLYKEGLVSRERVQVVGKAYPEFAYSIPDTKPDTSNGDIESAILEVLGESEKGLKVRAVAKKLKKKGIVVSVAKVRATLKKLSKEGKVEVDKSFAAYRYRLIEQREFSEKDILRAFYLEKQKIEDIAEQFGITPEQVVEIVTSERGKLYAEVNCNFDAEKLQETLKKEVELMKDLTRDAAVEGEA